MSVNNYFKKPDGSQLTINEIVRHSHKECGDTKDRLYVKRTTKGYLYHCHNCAPAFSGFRVSKDLLSPDEIIREIVSGGVAFDVDEEIPYQFPIDFSQKMPIPWCNWLFRYGITTDEVESFGIGWSPSSGHLIMPVFNLSGTISAWTERVSPKSPMVGSKYIFRGRRDAEIDNHLCVLNDESNDVVLVEDYISTIKCGRVVNAMCLNGSHLPGYMYPELRQFGNVFIWLDQDKKQYAYTLMKRLSSMGHKTHLISTKCDPKEHSPLRMEELFDNAMSTRMGFMAH